MGLLGKFLGRAFENYESVHKFLRHTKGDKVAEYFAQHKQLSTNTLVEVRENAGETVVDIGKTELAITLTCTADDAYYTGALITLVYKNSDGLQKTAIATGTATLNATPVAFVPAIADYYCPVSLISNKETQAGETLTIISGGSTYGTIAAESTDALDTALIGVGSIYGSEAANQDDTGYIATTEYLTPWGELKEATWTFPADSSVATAFIGTDGKVVKDFYRKRTFEMDNAAIDECRICNAAKDAIYAAIEVANYECFDTRFMALGSAYGKSYFGELICSSTIITDVMTVSITYTAKDRNPTTVEHDFFVNELNIIPPFELEPLSEVTIKIKDQNVAHGNVNVFAKYLDVLV